MVRRTNSVLLRGGKGSARDTLFLSGLNLRVDELSMASIRSSLLAFKETTLLKDNITESGMSYR